MATVKLVNQTRENIKLAIFKKPYRSASLKLIAWTVEALPGGGGNKELNIPTNYQAYINYSKDPGEREDPNGGTKTAPISIDVQTARFEVIEEPTNDNQASVSTLKRVFTDLVGNEIQIENQASFGVWGHILLAGQDVYPPQIITPGRTLMEDVRSPLYVAVIDEFIFKGDLIKVEELSSSPVEILTGDTVTINGSKWNGYEICKS